MEEEEEEDNLAIAAPFPTLETEVATNVETDVHDPTSPVRQHQIQLKLSPPLVAHENDEHVNPTVKMKHESKQTVARDHVMRSAQLRSPLHHVAEKGLPPCMQAVTAEDHYCTSAIESTLNSRPSSEESSTDKIVTYMPNMHEVATSVLSENMLASKEAHDAMDDNIVTVSEQYPYSFPALQELPPFNYAFAQDTHLSEDNKSSEMETDENDAENFEDFKESGSSSGIFADREKMIHVCPQCVKGFPNQSSLNKHMTSHSDYRPFQCVVCSKKFKRLDHLNSHGLTHKGMKPHACGINMCMKRYSDPRSLKRHKEKHHPIEMGLQPPKVPYPPSDDSMSEPENHGEALDPDHPVLGGPIETSSIEWNELCSENVNTQRNIIRVGEEFQAALEPLRPSRGTVALQSEVLWIPDSQLPEDIVETYCKVAHSTCMPGGKPYSAEYALFVLLRNSFRIKAALAQLLSGKCLQADFAVRKCWNEDEKRAFEEGFSCYGKQFQLIHKMVPTRSLGEIIHFYYMWKKMENSKYRYMLGHQRKNNTSKLLTSELQTSAASEATGSRTSSMSNTPHKFEFEGTDSRVHESDPNGKSAGNFIASFDGQRNDGGENDEGNEYAQEYRCKLHSHTLEASARKVCSHCEASDSSLWHKGHSMGILCHACYMTFKDRGIINYAV